MSMNIKYTKKDVAEFSGLDLRKTQFYCDQGVIQFEKAESGRGYKRLYSKANLLEAKVAKILSDHGMTLMAIKAVMAYLNQPSVNCFEKYTQYLKGRFYIVLNFNRDTGKLNIEAQIKGGVIKDKDCVLTVADLEKFSDYWVLNYSSLAAAIEAY